MPGTFFDIEDLEDTQDFFEYALPDIFTPNASKISMVMKLMNFFCEEGASQILNLVT